MKNANHLIRVIDPNGTKEETFIDSAAEAVAFAQAHAEDGWETYLYGPADNTVRRSRAEVRAWNVPDACPTDCGCRVPGMPIACPTTTHSRTLGTID